MKSLITQAIQDRRLIQLTYDDLTKTVEPHVLGLTKGQQEALLCWQVAPPMRQAGYWRVLLLADISDLRVLESRIEGLPEGPVPPPDAFDTTYAILQR